MFLFFSLLLILLPRMSFASDYQVFEVRQSLPMENNDPGFKDYYINAGSESGLKKGLYITVIRNTPIQDPAKNVTQGTLKIPISHVQIIQVDKHLSVAREIAQVPDEERSTVEFEGIMVGDVLDMESATNDAPKIKKRKSVALEEEFNQKLEHMKAEMMKMIPQPAAAQAQPAPAPAVAPAAQAPQPAPAAAKPPEQVLQKVPPPQLPPASAQPPTNLQKI